MTNKLNAGILTRIRLSGLIMVFVLPDQNHESAVLQTKPSPRKLIIAKSLVAADYKAASFDPDIMERRRTQSETLSAVFEIDFRILKHTMQSIVPRPNGDTGTTHVTEAHPLLGPCLDGLGKFSHLIDLDYIGDLMNYLKKLACSCGKSDSSGKCVPSRKDFAVASLLLK
ncbi:uncharacterized protein LOC104453040 isoform X1 [Eucalyptus grandis]|uniref:uncharacterized protein LOC104453040 isoform X1 n=1 Tax=Eucalyptus grandis TaxID=71139 RepID=UPI00192EAFE5|nr:uncharacterized protein LOC104453040 isoform X1 [Eucalyptus grandis]